jgi:hypothetical protein
MEYWTIGWLLMEGLMSACPMWMTERRPRAARRDLTLARTIMGLALVLAAYTRIPNPYPSQPWVGPDGRVVQPPLEGWPDYTKGRRGF